LTDQIPDIDPDAEEARVPDSPTGVAADAADVQEPVDAAPLPGGEPAAERKPLYDKVVLGPFEFSPRGSIVLIAIITIGINVLLIVIVVIAALIRAGKL
jgi:hypothetical protein